MRHLSIFLGALILSLSALATGSHLVPSFIQQDLVHEIGEADYLSLSAEQKTELIQHLTVRTFSYLDLTLLLKKYFTGELGESLASGGELKVTLGNRANPQYMALYPLRLNPNKQHAIGQLELYVQNRLGDGTLNSLSHEKTQSYVIGGNPDKIENYLASILPAGKFDVVKIPSLYETWGIAKFFIPRQLGINTQMLIWVVPPGLRYVRHYLSIFDLYSKVSARGFLDESAADSFQKLAVANAKNIGKNKFDYLLFGYDRVWLETLQKQDGIKVTGDQTLEQLALGVKLRIIEVTDLKTNRIFRLALFSSSLTVWGELIALHLKYFLSPELRAVIFMGSAGSLDESINPYDVSVPLVFSRPGREIKIGNFLNFATTSTFESLVHRHARHGNTTSPIEQDRRYLLRTQEKGIQTLDVEQSLVAEVINDFNSLHLSDIKFGAVNVVTDKPYALLQEASTQYNLDEPNPTLKQQARKTAVSLTLEAILKNERKSVAQACAAVLAIN